MPNADLPGIGASIAIDWAAKAKAISSVNEVICLTFTPGAGFNSNLDTAGPWTISVILALIPNSPRVFRRWAER